MARFKITGGTKLSGEIKVGGAKNSALKLLPAAILADSPSVISNVPDILDIQRSVRILTSIGAKIEFNRNTVSIDPRSIDSHHPDETEMKKLRGSIVLVGALLSRFGEAVFFEPGGCLIGSRPIDDHLDLFEQLGVAITKTDRTYHLDGKPKAGKIVLRKMSVTATENAILATVLSPGTTTIHDAAAEPEIADLANFLNKMGAKITGAGTHDITINGVDALHGADYVTLTDRIEAGTYIIAALATNSELTIGPIVEDHMSLFLKKLSDTGAKFEIIERDGHQFIKTLQHDQLIAQPVDTRTYPGFSTDLQSPYAALMTQAKGTSNIFETMFEGRFAYLEEFKKMGAQVEIINPHEFNITGSSLHGAEVSGADIRGCSALVIAGLAANGETIVDDIEYVDRGYEKMDEKLRAVGAQIERLD